MTEDGRTKMDACAVAARTGPQHQALARFEGAWRAEVRLWMDPTGQPQISRGTMRNSMVLGGRFVQQEYADDAGMFQGKGFWGYNHIDQRFEGFWIDTMSTFFQIEHGKHDPASDTYTMRGTMTDPSTGKLMKKRSVIKVAGPNAHSLEMFFEGDGSQEFKAMEIRYHRA